MISVVINTRNEERNLPNALASVLPWAAEVVVVDMESTDATKQIASKAGCRVFDHEICPVVEPAREFAIAQAQQEWVFVLDADEMVPESLSRRLLEAISLGPKAFLVPRRNYLVGKALEGAGWAPHQDHQLRLFRKDAIEFPNLIHQNFAPRAGVEVAILDAEPIVHFNYLGYADFIARLNRYTDVESGQLAASNKQRSRFKVIRNAWRAFARRYYKQGGKSQGDEGFYLSAMMAFYTLATEAKASQLRGVGDDGAIREAYRQVAEKVKTQYARKV